MSRFLLLVFLFVPLGVFAQDRQQIRELPPVTASDIEDDSAVLFGVDKIDVPRSYRFSLEELKKTGVQVVNVMQFGAVGDGVTDDSLAFTNAVNSLPVTGGIIYFPPGSYLGEMAISSRNNITIRGDGPLTKLKGTEGFESIGSNCISLDDCDNVLIRDLWMEGTGESDAATESNDCGLYAVDCNGLTVVNCKVTNHGFAGISLSDCTDVTLKSNRISEAAGFSLLNASDIFVSGDAALQDYQILNNLCTSTNAYGIAVHPNTQDLDHKRFQLSGNICSNHTKFGIAFEITLTGQNEDTIKAVAVSANMAENNGDGGIYLQNVNDSIVSGNTTRANDFGQSGNSIEGGIFCYGCNGIAIVGNSVFDELGAGIMVNGHPSYVTRRTAISISGNTVRNQATAGHHAIWLRGRVRDCVVEGNSIYGGVSNAIHVDGTGVTKRVSICNNMIHGETTATMGISLDGSTISGVVVGNTVVNTVSGLVFHECSAIVKNNISLLNTTRDVWLSNSLPDFKFSDNRFSTLTNTNANVVTPNFSNGDTTPSVIGRGWYKTANTNSTTYTALDDGVDGQVVTILFADGNSHVDFTGTTLRGNGGVDWDPGSGDHMTCTRISGIWYCVVSDN